MTFAIRPYHPSDLPSLYRICLLTGDSGADASRLYQDPDLLGHYYAGPYAVFEPDVCFVLTADGVPSGYVLGTRDSAGFRERCERDWFPLLRERYPLRGPDDQTADARIIRLIHAGHHVRADLAAYPAHLHIDLLPAAQGRGWGRRLMQTFLAQLRALEIPGVHLGVGTNNRGAVQFYERVGFARIQEHQGWIAFGMRLAPED